MKNAYLYSLLVSLATFLGYGQNENNHWILGTSDVNFSSTTPSVSTVSNSGNYGKASISDANGDLLFYTNGISVWNKNHQAMPGGALHYNGGYYIGRAFAPYIKEENLPVIIVPVPGNDKKYYVFTTLNDIIINSNYSPRYSYHFCIVDFTDTMYPLGKIIDSETGDMGEAYLDFSFRPITCVKNSTNDGYYVITHDPRSASNGGTLLVHKVTSSGLTTNIGSYAINHAMPYTNYSFDDSATTIGVMRFSKDNSKFGELISNNGNGKSLFYTLDFNNSNGTFSNYTEVESNLTVGGGYYKDFEFSEDSSKAFLVKNNSNIYVKDLTNLSLAARRVLDFVDGNPYPVATHLQRDKNDNLLVSYTGSSYMHKINNQNNYTYADVSSNFVSLTNTLNFGHTLPQLIPSLQCSANMTITSNVTSGTSSSQASNSITASNTISSGAIAIYHAGSSVVLTNGFHAANGSRFRAYIEGCSGAFVGRMGEESDSIKDLVKGKNILVYPNPSSNVVTIASESIIKNISITSMEGKTVLNQNISNENEVAVNVSSFEKGIYIVTVETQDGGINIQKLIKK